MAHLNNPVEDGENAVFSTNNEGNQFESSDSDSPALEMQNVTAQMPNPVAPLPSNALNMIPSNANHNNLPSTSTAIDVVIPSFEPLPTKKSNKWMYILISICTLSLLYSTFGVTYLLMVRFDPNINDQTCKCSSQFTSDSIYSYNTTIAPSTSPTDDTSSSPSEFPSNYPSNIPTYSPTKNPTYIPSIYPSNKPSIAPSDIPSKSPTKKPTLQPTTDLSPYENFVGDFKISAQNTSHGHWLLCDGSFVDPNIYTELFNVIGYSFGSQIVGTVKEYALPNKTVSSEIGMISYFEKKCPDGWTTYSESNGRFIITSGSYSGLAEDNRNETKQYEVGESGGEIEHKLIINEIPSHNHLNGNFKYLLRNTGSATTDGTDSSTNEPDIVNKGEILSAGGDLAHNNMPPYLVLNACMFINPVANTFIFAG